MDKSIYRIKKAKNAKELAPHIRQILLCCAHIDKLLSRLALKYGLSYTFYPDYFPPHWELKIRLCDEPIIIECNPTKTNIITYITPTGHKYHHTEPKGTLDLLTQDLASIIETFDRTKQYPQHNFKD